MQHAEEPMPAGSTGLMTCKITGNILVKGERIYHLPRTSAYTRTLIEEQAGQRMLCVLSLAEPSISRCTVLKRPVTISA